MAKTFDTTVFTKTLVTDVVTDVFMRRRFDLSSFSNDYSGEFADDGDIITIPLIQDVQDVQEFDEQTTDFTEGSKSTGKVALQLGIRKNTVELTATELANGDRVKNYLEALTEKHVQYEQDQLYELVAAGVASSKSESLVIGDVDTFTPSTMSRKVRPILAKRFASDPYALLSSEYWARLIPDNRDGFDTNGAHYGFRKIYEVNAGRDENVVGIAFQPQAVAYASRIPYSLKTAADSGRVYLYTQDITLDDLGWRGLLVVGFDEHKGKHYMTLASCRGMALVKTGAALQLLAEAKE